jgi:hypothetical protein
LPLVSAPLVGDLKTVIPEGGIVAKMNNGKKIATGYNKLTGI